ncbi:meiotic nuclear division protein 1 homolog [Watersipora subatra]|uniref:meiotic nuclear division protein 1 homolog n=1 Tax=Watersipora subatra TaxID=2589382 RepID=UPI00355B7D19
MSKRKGLSVEEKRTRMMEFFYEKKDFYQLKELEKLCQKEKGITSMSVKDILTSLVDDGMVDTDKIGTSVYFWAFPGKARQKSQKRLSDLKAKNAELMTKKRKLMELIEQESIGKEPSQERDQVIDALAKKTAERDSLVSEMKAYRENDPEVLEATKRETKTAHESANRWTDNIFSIKSWVKNKFGFDDSTIDKQFGLPDDLDYLD